MNETVLETGVSGLICRQCEDLLVNRLSYVRGVIRVECSYFRGRASIQYDSEILSEEELKKKMQQSGFPAINQNGRGKLYDLITIFLIFALLFLVRNVKLPLIPKADNETSYSSLFLIGLVTGTHCTVMCGGIMLSQTAARKITEDAHSRRSLFCSVALYNVGRVLMAGVLGFLFGFAGKHVLFSVKTKSMVFTMTGMYILLVALAIWGVPIVRQIQVGLPSLCETKKKSSLARNAGSFLTGILTALLPCASSNSMWLLAVSSGGGVKGMLLMLSWAAGTVPCMVLFGNFASFLSGRKQAILIRMNIVLMMTLGLNMFIMGISMI